MRVVFRPAQCTHALVHGERRHAEACKQALSATELASCMTTLLPLVPLQTRGQASLYHTGARA